jgi:hypothetical protein
MRDRQDWEGSFGRFAVIALAFLVALLRSLAPPLDGRALAEPAAPLRKSA